jgi:hypothetical protein
VTTPVSARALHRDLRAALGPGFAADGYERLRSTSVAAWARPAGQEFIVCWVQPSRDFDSFGWYGSKFTIEFRRGGRPAIAVGGPSWRFCRLLDEDGREQVRAVQNAVIRRMPPPPPQVRSLLTERDLDWYLEHGEEVATPYSPRHDVWFRHRDADDLGAWLTLLPTLLPHVLAEVRQKLG